jgi:hypothetical protein
MAVENILQSALVRQAGLSGQQSVENILQSALVRQAGLSGQQSTNAT